MGETNKLLLPWKKSSIIRNSIETCIQSDADEVIVVLGHQSAEIRNELNPLEVCFVENPSFESGMLSSIQAAIPKVSSKSAGWMVFLGDQPKIPQNLVNQLIEQFQKHHEAEKDLIVLPVCAGIRRNPVIFSRSFNQRMMAHQGEGGKAMIDAHQDSVLEVEVEDVTLFEDIDTEEDYDLLKPN